MSATKVIRPVIRETEDSSSAKGISTVKATQERYPGEVNVMNEAWCGNYIGNKARGTRVFVWGGGTRKKRRFRVLPEYYNI